MIKLISQSISTWMIHSNVIDSEDRELYEYAVYSGILNVMPIFMSVIIGAILGITLEAIIFICPFLFIRKFSGGYHAKKPSICFICSLILLFGFLKAGMYINSSYEVYVLLILSSLLLCIFSPIDSEARRLEEKEIKRYKIYVVVLVSIFIGICILLTLLNKQIYAVYISLGVTLTFILQIPCIILKIIAKK